MRYKLSIFCTCTNKKKTYIYIYINSPILVGEVILYFIFEYQTKFRL